MTKSKGYRDLIVYQKAFALAMKIFHITKAFPPEEKYSLTDQIRRSSRSVCTCIAEAYRKRKYQGYFVNKISDADGENSETIVWLEFSIESSYIEHEKFLELEQDAEEVGRMLNGMLENPEKFLPKEKIKVEV
ncbi:MAG: four helix bundle protein [Bacteroidetes bacterium]|nr:four helix bundle protein [Bacteroidota bacterium]MBI3483424.1 four helix bundle protein [Bacteroidota bacterium]